MEVKIEQTCDQFYKTGCAYSWLGEGIIKASATGHIIAIIIKTNAIQAIFKTPINEDYMVHAAALGDVKNLCVYVFDQNQNLLGVL